MKVLCLTGTTRNAGGLFYAVSALCRTLQDNGVELSVFGRKDSCSDTDSATWGAVPLCSYPAHTALGISFQLQQLLADARGDLVHQHGIWLYDQWAALRWQTKTAKPVVISPHGMLDPWALNSSAWKKRAVERLFARKSLHQATCIHALCRSEAESIRAYGLTNPIAIIPNGVELPVLSPQKSTKENNKKTLLFLGRIHPKKGLQQLIEAWGAENGAWRENWSLTIAGWDDGGYEPALRSLVDSVGVSGSVQFAGPRFGEEKAELLRSADAFVLPSFSEGLPMSVLEAWAYGLPVLMTGFCNLPEGFSNKAAIRITPDVDSVISGLGQLAGMDADALKSMGANGRALVESTFTWQKVAGEMKQVYEWCATGGSAPACVEV
ncbi:MAG: glycosyltransferase [Pontiellaceae bacterium]|nr:glycosyltransferase [Pontiellaceae bacterium]MBN2784003.1 glycosyltransferase [Pontiellaceae bacterium]